MELFCISVGILKIPQKPLPGPSQGKELISVGSSVVMTYEGLRYEWKAVHSLSRAEIENDAVKVGLDGVSKTNLYVCRKPGHKDAKQLAHESGLANLR
jgi:hypothetical protein